MSNWEKDSNDVENEGISNVEALIVEEWNSLIHNVLEAEIHWKTLNDLFIEHAIHDLEQFPLKIQKGLAMFRKQKFNVMLPRFIDYARTAGGIEAMLSEEKQ